MSNDYFNPPNSIWPNGLKRDEEGYVNFYPIGTNKVDISTITWPEGDKLISPFVYQNDELVGFVDTKALTVSGSATTIMNYNHIEADFASISEGKLTVNAPNATVKKFSWSIVDSGDDNVIVTLKYKGCKTVNDVKAVDSNYKNTDIVDGVWSEGLGDLEDGADMFSFNYYLTSFSSDLSSLINGNRMFILCDKLTSFSADLSSLTNGEEMFRNCNKLTSFSSDLTSLSNGVDMFSNCSKLESFNADLSNLTDGDSMFLYCSNLTSFSSDLSSLTNGWYMFNGCKLDTASVKNIIDTINTYSEELYLGMGCNNTTEDKDFFAQEVGYTDMTTLLAALRAKDWIVSAQYNGRPTTTYSLRKTSIDILPVFVKLEEAEEHASYTSEDGSKKYRLNWFHETTGSTEGYTQYVTLEEAIETLNIKPIERN